ncbi:MAG: hypothetical protein AAGI23_05060 [Bacteroidota bacterium]
MNSPYLAKILLVVGLLIWGASEWNLLNSAAQLKSDVEVFDRDFGDDKLFPQQYRVVVDWGDQQFIYGEGREEIVLKRKSSWTYDLSWIPFFKSYKQRSEWSVSGVPFNRASIDLKIDQKTYGFVSRKDIIAQSRERASKQLIRSFRDQSFYANPLLDFKKSRIFRKCF